AEQVLAEWHPHMAVIDMDNADSASLLRRLAASGTLAGGAIPALGLTRRGDLKTKLRALDLGVDDILTVPFSPEELLARSIVITRRVLGSDHPIVPTIRLGEMEIDMVNRHIRSLRIKLQNDYRHPRFIATVAGRGYRFIPTFTNAGWDPGQDSGGP